MREPLLSSKRWALLYACGSAILLILAFPYTRLWWLTFIALVPLLSALAQHGVRRGLLLGTVFGFLFQSYIMFWANFFGPPAYLFLALYKTVLPALLGALCGLVGQRRPALLPLTFALGWIAMEYLQTFGPFGVTWGMLSHAWARVPAAIQISSLAGPWAWSLVLLCCNLAVFCRLRAPFRSQFRVWAALSVVGVLGSFAFGWWRLQADWGQAPAVTVGAVQVSMGRDVRWDPNFAKFSLSRLEQLSREAGAQGARLIVWPETAIPYRNMLRSPELTHHLGLLARELGSWMIVGSIERVGDAQKHTLNTASLLSPEGGFEGRYDKQRLVPGGEYLPLERWLRRYKIFDPVMRYVPGKGNGVFRCALDPKGGAQPASISPGVLICFESMVPYLARDRVRDGADTLVIATNDGWFGSNPAIYHHFEMAIFRAIEQGKPVIQCGNTGVSGMIDERGRVLRETPINQSLIAVFPLQPRAGKTLYHSTGDWLPWASLAGILLIVLGLKGSPSEMRKD